MKLRELYTTFIFEGPADVVKSLRATYSEPNQIDLINKNYEWIKNTFPKGAEWYMLLVGAYLKGDQNKLQTRLGGYAFTSFEQLQQDLSHFSTLDYQPIKDYAFNNKPVKQVFDELSALENTWKKLPSRPVVSQEGDRVLKDYGNGIQWWFVDRAFCPEEGRSGKHCGNVVGQSKTDQRILSLRHNMKVILTFIYLPNGFLGEMKATGNQKPDPKYHPQVMDLLLGNLGIEVAGIKGAGWGPEFNFSIFDLDEKNLNVIMQTNPSFIASQIKATPREILKAPNVIRTNLEYQNLAIETDPNLANFFVNGKLDLSIAAWERAIETNPKYVIYAPVELDNYKERTIAILIRSPRLFLESPRHVIKDREIVMTVVKEVPEAISYIPPAGLSDEIYKVALSKDGNSLRDIPEERRTPALCKLAVSQKGSAIIYVPDHLKTPELYKLAISTGAPLDRIPDEYKTEETYTIAVKAAGMAIDFYVPAEYKTYELYKLAVLTYPYALKNIPEEFKTKEMYTIAVKADGVAIKFVPDEYKTLELCKLAVTSRGYVINDIPDEFKTLDMYKIAVKTNGGQLRHVPEEDRSYEMCKDAVHNDATALQLVPEHLRTPELCKTAVKGHAYALDYVPEHLRTPELCELAVRKSGHTLAYVPEHLQTAELCKLAVKQNSWAIEFVKSDLLTLELCKIAVNDFGAVLASVPEHLKTPEICKTAVINHGPAIAYVPDAIGENDPDTYFKICKLALTVGWHADPDEGEDPGYAGEALSKTGYKSLLSSEQQHILEQLAINIDNEYDDDE